jgi:hypothetical protein
MLRVADSTSRSFHRFCIVALMLATIFNVLRKFLGIRKREFALEGKLDRS